MLGGWLAGEQIVTALALTLFLFLAGFLLHVQTPEATIHDEQYGDEACRDT